MPWGPSADPLCQQQPCAVLQVLSNEWWVKGNSPFPWSLGYASVDTAWYAVSLYGHQGHTSGLCSACGPQVLLSRAAAKDLSPPRGRILHLSFPISGGSSWPFPTACPGAGEGQSCSQIYWPAIWCLKPWQGHALSWSQWNYLCLQIYMNGKWSKLNFIFSMLWDIQNLSVRCSQTKSLLGGAVFVQLYSAQPEILIADVRHLLFLGAFSYLVCNESVCRTRQSFLC